METVNVYLNHHLINYVNMFLIDNSNRNILTFSYIKL